MLDHRFWKEYFKVYDVLNLVIPYQELLGEITKEADIKKGELVFDAGSGTGNLAMKIKEAGGGVIGMDISKEGIEAHKQKDLEARTFLGSLTEKLPFQSEYFDKICSNNVIYTIPQEKRDGLMKELFRVLRPGGKIVITNIHHGFSPLKIYFEHIKKEKKKKGLAFVVRNIAMLASPTIKMFYFNRKIKKEHHEGDFSFFAPDEQRELLERAGFKNISKTKSVYADQGILNSGYKL